MFCITDFVQIKTFKMPIKLYYDTTDDYVVIKVDSYKPLETNTSTYANNATMGLNDNAQEPGGGNENEV